MNASDSGGSGYPAAGIGGGGAGGGGGSGQNGGGGFTGGNPQFGSLTAHPAGSQRDMG